MPPNLADPVQEPQIEIKDRSQAESILQEIADLVAQHTGVEAIKRNAIATLNANFNPDLERLANQIATREKWLETWLAANPQEIPPKKKFIDLHGGRLGYRNGRPGLGLLSRAETREGIEEAWKRVFEIAKADFEEYVEVKFSLNKDQILADATTENKDTGEKLLDEKGLEALGLKLVQEEKFYIKLTAA